MDSPFLVWCERDASGAEVSCLVVPGRPPAVICYREGKIERVPEFERLEDAQALAQELRANLLRSVASDRPTV